MNALTGFGRSATLTVLSGLNSGAEEAFGSREIVLGGGEEDDVVLDELPPGAVGLRQVGGEIEVSARAAPATVGAEALNPSETTRAALPARVTIDGRVTIYIGENAAAAPPAHGSRGRLWTAVAVLAGGGAAAVLLLLLQLEDPPPPSGLAAAPSSEEAAPSTPIGPDCVDCVREAADELRRTLADTPLRGLEVGVDGGAVRVAGAMPADLRALWTNIRVEYDTKWGRAAPLVAQISQAPDVQPIAVSAVWLGATPEVIDAGGARYRIGDATVDGWVVEKIDADAIALTRDGVRLILTF